MFADLRVELNTKNLQFLQLIIVWSYLCISFVPVPDEAQLGVGGHGVVGSYVTVEQGTFDPDRLTRQNVVLLQIHRPV